jgi:uncharacterized protein with gpF-like domain
MGAINPANKQRQRALDDALQIRMSARFERRLRTEIGRTMREAAAAYEKRGELAIPLAVSEHSQAIRNVLESNYRLVANHFGKRLLSDAKTHTGPQIIKASLTEMLGLAVNGFINRWIATKVVQINRTTESQIRDIIRGGIDEGFGVDKIGKRIRELSTPFSALRAHVIARTETHTAANFGAQQAAELTGIDMKREWVSSMDDRTRDEAGANHVRADGQVVGMNEPFTVSGEKLMFPGDPAGSAENTIMCRCQVVFLYD